MKIPDKYDTIFRLTFDDPELGGLEVRVRRSFGLLAAAGALEDVDDATLRDGHPRTADLQRMGDLVDAFADALVSWNLETGDGEPMPTDTVRSLDVVFVMVLVRALLDNITQLVQQMQADLQAAAAVDEADLPQTPS